MAYSEQVLHRAQMRLAKEKADFEAAAADRVQAVYSRLPRLKQIEQQLQHCAAQAVIAAFRKDAGSADAIDSLKKESLALQQERDWVLKNNDLELAALEVGAVCPDCGGSGYIGAVMCKCLRELCRQEQIKELSSLLSGEETFDDFRLDYYSMETDPQVGVSPRSLMQRTFLDCRKYAEGFQHHSPSLLFSGNPGLGKTFLSACIARTVANRGFSVVYDTAGKLFSDFEAVKFGGNQDDLTAKYLGCDLLIIDDLGTELVTQFTYSVLYQVINTRLLERKPVIVSTNLSKDAIQKRYPGPIASRLIGSYLLYPFLGSDIRLINK